LAVDDEHVGTRELFVGREGLHALGVGVPEETFMPACVSRGCQSRAKAG